MFAYCNNNPVIAEDQTGELLEVLIVIGIGIGLGIMLSGCSDQNSGSSESNEYYSITETSNKITITAKMAFQNCTNTGDLIKGIRSNWEGTYKIGGNYKKVEVNIQEVGFEDPNAIHVYVKNEDGRSYSSGSFGNGAPSITLYTHIHGSEERMDWVIAHEFGHCLGVGDYYIDGVTDSFSSIMNSRYMHASNADIEMVLKAYSTGAYCRWR